MKINSMPSVKKKQTKKDGANIDRKLNLEIFVLRSLSW